MKNEELFNNYFRVGEEDIAKPIDSKGLENYTYSQDYNKTIVDKEVNSTSDIKSSLVFDKGVAKGNIEDIDKMCEILKTICSTAWGDNWGEFINAHSNGLDSKDVPNKCITYELNERVIPEKFQRKPKLFTSYAEVVNGIKTGDIISIYKIFYMCELEFNIISSNITVLNNLTSDFEELMFFYSGYLKEHGVSEIEFYKEKNSKFSSNSTTSIPGTNKKTLLYKVKLEKNYIVRNSTLSKITAKINML